jgi:single-strand selective monofunctional uracil DNA glycosylase
MESAIIRAARALARDAQRLPFGPPVSFVYNPLLYARGPHEEYLRRYARPGARVVLVGMNPGPWGMAQTGVPFGEVSVVRDWLGVGGKIGAPHRWHPRLPVTGFQCPRSEVSGRRLWGLLKDHYGTVRALARDLFVSNYCPLLFLDQGGRNLTPDKIAQADRAPLYALSDGFLRTVLAAICPEWVVGVGAFATGRIRAALKAVPEMPVRVATVLHPSPASPRANRDWAAQARAALLEQGVW